MPTMDQFLAKILEIEGEQPKYRKGGSATDGTCDCIGLVIGALARCGYKWPGLHGSNWAARNACVRLRNIVSTKSLARGDLVFKAYDQFDQAYDLPSRYKTDKDPNDYYHVGVVYSTDPLIIIHCTTGKHGKDVIRDAGGTKWTHVATLKYISATPDPDEGAETQLTDMIVTCTPGQTVRLRRTASSSGAVIERIANGELVRAAPSASPGWHLVTHGEHSGYMMSAFLEMPDGSEQTVTLTLPISTAKLLLQALQAATGGGA